MYRFGMFATLTVMTLAVVFNSYEVPRDLNEWFQQWLAWLPINLPVSGICLAVFIKMNRRS